MSDDTWTNHRAGSEPPLSMDNMLAFVRDFEKPIPSSFHCGTRAHALLLDAMDRDCQERPNARWGLFGPQVFLRPEYPSSLCAIYDQNDQLMKLMIIVDETPGETVDLLRELETAVGERSGVSDRMAADAAQSADCPDDEAGTSPLRLESAGDGPANGCQSR